MKICRHQDNFGKCNLAVVIVPDKTRLVTQEWMTGRKLWGGAMEITVGKRHPLVQTNFCYFHTKKMAGLFDPKFHKQSSKAKALKGFGNLKSR